MIRLLGEKLDDQLKPDRAVGNLRETALDEIYSVWCSARDDVREVLSSSHGQGTLDISLTCQHVVSAYEVFFRCGRSDLVKVVHLLVSCCYNESHSAGLTFGVPRTSRIMCSSAMLATFHRGRHSTNDDDNRFLGIEHLQVLPISPNPKSHM